MPLAVACLALVMGAAAACSHADKPYAGSLPKKPSASPTPTKSHTQAPPKPTAKSAIATANRAIAAMNTLYAEQDGRALRTVSNVSCGECERFFHSITTKKSQGYHFSGGKITLRGRPTYSGFQKSTKTAAVNTRVAVGPLRVTDPSGKLYVSAQDPAGSGPGDPRAKISWLLVWDGSKWLVQGFDAENEAS